MSPYWDLKNFFNESLSDAPGYIPDKLNTEVCKPGTRGTIEEDFTFSPYNVLPYLDHFWTPWNPYGGRHNAIVYAPLIFDKAVTLFANGAEEEAFFHFGRCTHLLEDMGSIPHLFSDFHPDIYGINHNGYEKWCYENARHLQTSTAFLPVTSLPAAMTALGLETFRTARIAGTLNRDRTNPIDGDLGELFPTTPDDEAASYAKYISVETEGGVHEFWWLKGVGKHYPGGDPTEEESSTWGKIPPLPGDTNRYYYIQYNQENVAPASVWSVADQAYVPNTYGFTLANLWAGTLSYRATRDQPHGMIPRTIEYTAGFLKYLWDFINPPPHLSGVRIEQDQDGNGEIDPADEVILDSKWVPEEELSWCATRRPLSTSENPAMRMATRIELRFSEPVRNVTVALGKDGPTMVIGSDLVSGRGPPTQEFPDGEPLIVLSGVDLTGLPEGAITLFVQAEDLSNHIAPVASSIDPDPSTRAGRLPDGSWRNIETGHPHPGMDSKHRFELGGMRVRGWPEIHRCDPGQLFSHEIQVRNLSLPEGSEAELAVEGAAAGWGSNAATLNGLRLPLPAPGRDWTPLEATLNVACTTYAVSELRTFITATAGGAIDRAVTLDTTRTTATPPGNDHPDDTLSVADPRFPTPWLLDTAAPVGILLNGWGAGIGHLLGSYGIATAPVPTDLRLVEGAGDLGALEVLVVGSGGLTGLDRLPSFREKLSRFVAEGGALIAFTPQRGEELAALPGGAIAGYGWSEDQACFGSAVRIAGHDASLSGQTSPYLDVGADGYLTRWPEDAEILLTRTSNGQPAMIRYRHGRGVVYLLTLYPDWAYGSGQSSSHERALVRDLVTAALAFPAAIPEFNPGEVVSIPVPVRNRTWVPTATASLDSAAPDRTPLAPTVVAQALDPGAHAAPLLTLTAPATPGILPVGYRLLDAGGRVRQSTSNAAFFAVPGFAPAPPPPPPKFRIWVTVPSDSVPVGGNAIATVHLSNQTQEDFSGAIGVSWVHFYPGPLLWVPDVFIPAVGEASYVVHYPVVSTQPFTIVYGLFNETSMAETTYREFLSIVQAWKGFQPFFAAANVQLDTATEELYSGIPLAVTVRVGNPSPGPLNADLMLQVRGGSNRVLWTESHAITVGASAEIELSVVVMVTADDPGFATLEAEVRQDSNVIGRATRILVQPPPALEISATIPDPWDPTMASSVTWSLRNVRPVPVPAGSLQASIIDPQGATIWSETAAITPLAVGAQTVAAFSVELPPLHFGNHLLRWTAAWPGGRLSASRLLRNSGTLTVAATPLTIGENQTLTGNAEIVNRGDFVLSGTLSAGSPDLLADRSTAVVLAPGATARLDFTARVVEETPAGTHAIAAVFTAADTLRASTDVVVPPAHLVLKPPALQVHGGGTLEITAVNVGGKADTVEWHARLLPMFDDPDDPLVAALSESRGTSRIALGESALFGLPVPADLATGTYAVVVTGYSLVTERTVSLATHVLVDGLAAALDVTPDREIYPATDPITAAARIANGARALSGAALELSISSAGTISPVAYLGTFCVSPGGSDVTGDGSRERPFATPQRGIDAAGPGDRVLLLAGTYTGDIVLRVGTILQGEVVAGEPLAVVSGSDIVGAAGTTIDHLAIRDGNVFYPGDVSSVRVTDCVFEGGLRATLPRGQGIVFRGAANGVLVGRNRLSGFGQRDAGVQFYSAASGVLVHENSFFDFAPSAWNPGVLFWNDARDVVVQQNTMRALSGDSSGIHFWGGSAPGRNMKVLNNRFENMAGDCSGVHFWFETEGVAVGGNHFSQMEGTCVGIHFWERTVLASVADNTLVGIRGDASGIQLWETRGTRHLGVSIENNRLADFSPLSIWSSGNGIVVWEQTQGLSIARNVLERLTDGSPEHLGSGIVIGASAASLRIERNVVRDSPAGIALRLPLSLPYRSTPPLADVVIANNLLLGDHAGFLHENLRDVDDVEFRDGIIAFSGRAGVLALGEPAAAALAAPRHTAFFGNAADAEGTADPAQRDGNLFADPLFADVTSGDFRLLDGSPCHDAGSLPFLDLGPLDDDLSVRLGPGTVAPDAFGTVHWRRTIPADLGASGTLDLEVSADPLPVGGRLLLRGSLRNERGQVLAQDTAAFTVQTDPVLLTLGTPRAVYRPGETVPVTVEALNTADTAVADLLLRVVQEGTEVHAATVTIPPGERFRAAFETAGDEDFVLHATAGLAVADLPIAIALPKITLAVQSPEIVDFGPFAVAALVENTGRVPASLSLDFAGAANEFTLQPGSAQAFTRSVSIDEDTLLVATIVGDATATARRLVRLGPALTVVLEAPPVQQAGAGTATLSLANTGTLGSALTLDLELTTIGAAPVAAWSRSVWLAAGATVREALALGHLAAGDYLLRATGGPLPASVTFRIAPSRAASLLDLVAGTALDGNGRLPVTISVANAGALDLLAVVSLRTAFMTTEEELILAAGELRSVAFALDVANVPPGDYLLVAGMRAEGGIELETTAPLPLHAALALTSVPDGRELVPGTPEEVVVTVVNSGLLRGAARVRLAAGELFDGTQQIVVPAGGEGQAGFTVTLPEDAPGNLPIASRAELSDPAGGPTQTRDFQLLVRQPYDLSIRGMLDRPVYSDGEVARFVLRVANRVPAAAPLRALISHGATRAWSDFTLTAGPELTALDLESSPGEIRLESVAAQGSLVSSALDLSDTTGASVSWDADVPEGCFLTVETRTGPSPHPDETWTPWREALPGVSVSESRHQFLQYRATLASAQPGLTPVLREVRIATLDPERSVVHSSSDDFAFTPLQVSASFPVDFSISDSVFFGVYAPSGRSIVLDALPIRRAAAHLAVWTDRARYAAGESLGLNVTVDAPGTIVVASPWQTLLETFAGPQSTVFPLSIPEEVASGTFLITADYLGERVTLPVEVSGHLVRVLEVRLDRPVNLPGQQVGGTLVLATDNNVGDVTLEGWVSTGRESLAAFSERLALPAGVTRHAFLIAGDQLPAGESTLVVQLFRAVGGEPRALFLAGAQVSFEVLAPNRAPAADAGPDRSATERSWVELDGSASTDPDGDRLEWRWSQTIGPVVDLHGRTTARPVFVAPDVGRNGSRLSFALEVSDGLAWSPADSIEVDVADINRRPVAHAGLDTAARVGQLATLDASNSHDADGDLLSFAWTLASRPEESAAVLESPEEAMAGIRPDVPGNYTVALVVSDGLAQSDADTVVVSTINSRPHADAGADRTARPGERVVLDGGASDDADGDPLTYVWALLEQPEGSDAELEGDTTASPALFFVACGRHILELRVHDGSLESDPDQVVVDCANVAPTADAGPDRAARLGEMVTLDGGGSSDADRDGLAFRWAFTALPSASSAVLDDPSAPGPAFVADAIGTFALSLVVSDGIVDSDPDGTSVEVGTDVAKATIALKPVLLRLEAPPVVLRARIELPDGFSAREIAPATAVITAVGKKTLARPIRRIAARGAAITDADRDGRPELTLYYPVKALLPYLKAGTRTKLTFKGPLATWGRFIGSALLRVAP